jgi:tetratricopeptide (TPR) repeat protein
VENGVSRPSSFILLAAVVFAVTVETMNAIGWEAWEHTARQLAEDPDRGAVVMAEAAVLALPSAVMRARRLVGVDLARADQDTIVRGLGVLSRRQIRWQPADADGFLNRARVAMLEGDLDGGWSALDEALVRDPKRPFTLRLAALVARYRGAFDDGLELLAQAEAVAPAYRNPEIELTPDDEEWLRFEGLRRRLQAYPRVRVVTLIELAEAQRANGQNEEAWLTIGEGAGDPRADLVRARWHLAEEDAASTVEIARGLTTQRRLPSSVRADAWSLLARALEVEGDSAGALEAAGEALRLNPDSARPYRNLARIAVSQGDLEMAMQYLRAARGMEPTNLSVLFEIARVAEMADKPGEAKLVLERAFELAPEQPAVAVRLVDFLLRHGKYMEAAMTLSTALDRHPANADLLRRAEKLSREVHGQ